MPEAVIVAAFYHFFPFAEYAHHRAALKKTMLAHGVKGTVLLAPEGVNGTVSGPREGVEAVLGALRAIPELAAMEHKESACAAHPFARSKVKLKKELISLGVPADPMRGTGIYREGEEWNRLIADPATLVIDTRNTYEIHLGTFEGAVNPGIRDFKELPAYVRENLDPARHKRIAAFCTGGIRCEKFTAYLREQGFDEVYHLKGGILKYLEETPPEQSRWQGECYVFDERVAVTHRLTPSPEASMCPACGHALKPQDRAHAAYRLGVSCSFCPENTRKNVDFAGISR